jgi:RNA polymerase sigma-70 factor (ECF subfamily)
MSSPQALPGVSDDVQTGPGEALEHLPALQATSRALTRNGADAEDLVQEAYLRAFRSWHQFQPGTSLKAWLLTILRNLARNRYRDRQRALRVVAEGADHDQAARVVAGREASPEQVLLSRAMAPRLQTALESLPKSLRDAIWLRDVEELSYAEIAQRLRIPLGTVMSRISRGRRLLHDRLVAGGGDAASSTSSESARPRARESA